jgi:hypothetical protein
MKRLLFVAVAMLVLTESIWAQTLDPNLITKDGEMWIRDVDEYRWPVYDSGIKSFGFILKADGSSIQINLRQNESEFPGKWHTNEKRLIIASEQGFSVEYHIQDNGNTLIVGTTLFTKVNPETKEEKEKKQNIGRRKK